MGRVVARKTAKRRKKRLSVPDRRLRIFRVGVVLGFLVIAVRLFSLQVLSHDFYASIASNQHAIYKELIPERGNVYLRDPKSRSGIFPAAINKNLSLVFASPRDIEDPASSAEALADILELEYDAVLAKLALREDPYEPLKREVTDDVVERIKELELRGIGFIPEPFRFYPEKNTVSHLLGFVGSNENGERVGRYGIEGFWDDELRGVRGFLETERDPVGRWIGAADRNLQRAEDGADLHLTIDRTIQYITCDKLREAVARHGAAGGTVVIAEPKTGAILAMCSVPDFDPNTFSEVEDYHVFNNPAVFTPYEPGSVFKPFTMAAAIDEGEVTPSSTYNDEGEVKIGPYTIRNSDLKAHGWQTMTQVLEKSLNTGVIHAVGEIGPKRFLKYVRDFGFGEPTGIELDTEVGGDISSLSKRGDIWSATASFGQGITVTPLQLVMAYGALANGGKLMRPYIVEEKRFDNGDVVRTEPTDVRQVVTKRTSTLVSGMLVRVVEDGHGKRAAVPGYYVAGKTGTAQIAKSSGGYESDAFVGSFAGFAPVDDPAFVMAVKIDKPRGVQWAEATAAPLFGEIASFLLQYLQIPPERPI